MRHLHSSFAVLTLVLLLSSVFAVTRSGMSSKAAAKQQATVTALAEMLRIWQGHGLPIPPSDAPLARFPTPTSFDDLGTPRFGIGFLLQDATSQKPGTILSGYTKIDVELGDDALMEKILPDAANAGKEFIAGQAGISGINSLLGVAVHCEARGWTDFAGRLLARAVAPPVARPPFYANSYRKEEDAVSLTYRFIWQHLLEEVMRPGSDRRDIADRMKKLLDAGHDLPHGIGNSLHDALTTLAQAETAGPETIIAETLLERLLESRNDRSGGEAMAMDDPYLQMEAMGFAAVPTLLKHLDDHRLTSAIAWEFCKSETQQRRLGWLVRELLHSLAGEKALGSIWQKDEVIRKNAPEWWEKARAIGEEAWLVEGAAAKENKATAWPNRCHLRLLQLRYPERLADVLLYQLKHRPKAQSHSIISAVEECKLAGSWKLAVMMQADALMDHHQTSRASQKVQSRYDRATFNREAIKAFDGMAENTKLDYYDAPERELSYLALQTDDAMVWDAFLRATKRAVTGLRMELLKALRYSIPGGSLQSQRLAFLRAFLDDTSPGRLEEGPDFGSCCEFNIPELRVCDFAAMQVASIMKWADRPDENWIERRWDNLRERVRRLPSKR